MILDPFPYRSLIFIPVLLLTLYTFYSTTGASSTDYQLALGWLTISFVYMDYIVITDAQRELRQVPDTFKDGFENASLWRRVRWAASLLVSPRGVGWAHEPRNALPPHPPKELSRTRFVLQRLRTLAVLCLLHDLGDLHARANPMFHSDGPGLRADGWFWRFVVTFSWAMSTSTMLCAGFTAVSIVAVATGVSEPYLWPAFMGGPREAYTIRRLWGRAWHQLMRRFVSAHGRRLVEILGLRRGGNPSAYTQLFVAFFLPAIVHYGAETMAFRSWHGGSLTFFMLQPFAIMLEDLVLYLGRRAGLESDWWRYVGYMTTWAWFAWCLPIWLEPIIVAGFTMDVLPVSVIMCVTNLFFPV
ncbi:MBOAT-2 domain-containing protein [Mycena kentingensis (nom. inval.)]|nr:MBOAT-2 domain-containing protein [Mycena kentingensis (nom. inval.)]